MKELRFKIPEGYVIDFYRSDFPNGYIKFHKLLDTRINEVDFSVRLYSAVRGYFCGKCQNFAELSISELSKISITEISMYRNIGKVTIQELKEFCLKHEIALQP